VHHPLLLPEFEEKGAQELGDGISCPMAQLLEEAVEIEGQVRFRVGLWYRGGRFVRWGMGTRGHGFI
jgi:hypothetical protein